MLDYIHMEKYPEKNGWWVFLGVDTESTDNKLNNKHDDSDLTEAIKQTFMEEYKQTYNK